MAVFIWVPAWGAEQEVKPSVTRVSFGDGYEQRIGNGINLLPRTWTLRFTTAPTTVQAIEDFLAATCGVTAFTWAPPTGATAKWVSEGWKRSIDSPGEHTLSTTFKEVFEP